MKKRYICSLIIATLLLLSSCNKWLDVKPKNQIETKELFSTEMGFKDALTGCYIKLKSRNAYGEKLTMSTVEHLVAHWNVTTKSTEEALLNHNYTHSNVAVELNSIYTALYNTIASANDILAYVDVNKSVFKNENLRRMIKAEALAIRAFCHFDILRLYGPVPRNLSIKTDNELAYVTNLTSEELGRHTYDQFKEFIEKDLNDASTILSEVDPLITHTEWVVNTPSSADFTPQDPFMGYRKFRFNYYAVEGIKARFYLYTGQKERAYQTAISLINAKEVTGGNKFSLSTSSDLSKGNYILSSEHLLSLSVFDLKEYAHPLFIDKKILVRTKYNVLKDVYANTTIDDRYIKGWVELADVTGKKSFTTNKYFQPEISGITDYTSSQIIPIIRLSEIYLIAMESGSLDECNRLAKTYYPARYLEPLNFSSETMRETAILNEYRRDFYAEGQQFFTYKRMASKRMLWIGRDIDPKEYILPMPDSDKTDSK